MSLQRALPRAARCLRQRLPTALPIPVQRRFMSSSPQGGGIPIPYITEVTVRPVPLYPCRVGVLLLTRSSLVAGGHVCSLLPDRTIGPNSSQPTSFRSYYRYAERRGSVDAWMGTDSGRNG